MCENKDSCLLVSMEVGQMGVRMRWAEMEGLCSGKSLIVSLKDTVSPGLVSWRTGLPAPRAGLTIQHAIPQCSLPPVRTASRRVQVPRGGTNLKDLLWPLSPSLSEKGELNSEWPGKDRAVVSSLGKTGAADLERLMRPTIAKKTDCY